MLKISIYKLIGLIFLSALSFVYAQEAELKESAKDVVLDLKNGNIDSVYSKFDETMKSQITSDQVAMIWTQLEAGFGEYKGIESQNISKSGKYSTVNTKLRFETSYANFQITYNSSNQISGLFVRPEAITDKEDYTLPDYINTENIEETDIFLNAEFELKGKLTLNTKTDKDYVFVLVHGSGPNDMDETIGPNKFFKNLAFGLTQNGFPVLRYNKITLNYASELSQQTNNLTLENEYFGSIKAAIEFIRNKKELKDKKIILIGHSLGVNAVTHFADNNDISGLILLAGSPRNLTEVYEEQLEYIFNIDGKIAKEEQQELTSYKEKMKYYHSIDNNTENINQDSLPMGLPKAYLDFLFKFNSIDNLKDTKKSVLIVNGGTDYQVTKKDFDIWKSKLSDKKNINFSYLENLNHIFAENNRMSVPSDYNIYSPIAPKLFDVILNWINSIN